MRKITIDLDTLPRFFLDRDDGDGDRNDLFEHPDGNLVPFKDLENLYAPTPARPSWDQYFMSIAEVVATRSTCSRKSVGAVIVRDRTILATGYNGSARGLPHCDETNHGMVEGDKHCQAVVHAEINAIAQAARHGIKLDGATVYVTASPCWSCFKTLVNAGVKEIFYREFYKDERIIKAAKTLGIGLTNC
jgi:dCMP deaminase